MSESNRNIDGTESSDTPMDSVSRMAKIPVVESTVNLASGLYTRVKESSEMVNSVLMKAESTVKQAVDMSKPVTEKLETPLKKVDSILCTGLDYVESTVPAIKLPPQEMFETAKNAVVNTVEPTLKSVYSMSEKSIQKVSSMSSSFSSRNETSTSSQQYSCCLHKDQPCPETEDT